MAKPVMPPELVMPARLAPYSGLLASFVAAEFADAAPIVYLETAAEGETAGLAGECWPAAMRRHDDTSAASIRSPKDSVSPLPTTMADHWWQRPGRLPGRELYHWHMLFHDQPKVQELAAIAEQRLAGLPGLDLVPRRWLHLTTLIVGFADEVPGGRVDAMVAQARRSLADIAPIPVMLGRVLYHPQAVTLAVEPLRALEPVLGAVRAATRAAGIEGHTDTDPWIPHVSVAYSHASGPAAPIIEALGRWLPTTRITVRSVSLVAQTQVGRSWQWRQIAELLLGSP